MVGDAFGLCLWCGNRGSRGISEVEDQLQGGGGGEGSGGTGRPKRREGNDAIVDDVHYKVSEDNEQSVLSSW